MSFKVELSVIRYISQEVPNTAQTIHSIHEKDIVGVDTVVLGLGVSEDKKILIHE